jgi:hypothetical protein
MYWNELARRAFFLWNFVLRERKEFLDKPSNYQLFKEVSLPMFKKVLGESGRHFGSLDTNWQAQLSGRRVTWSQANPVFCIPCVYSDIHSPFLIPVHGTCQAFKDVTYYVLKCPPRNRVSCVRSCRIFISVSFVLCFSYSSWCQCALTTFPAVFLNLPNKCLLPFSCLNF